MERAQSRTRQWRQSLSPEERQRYLARRRLIAQEKRQQIPTPSDDHTMTSPSNIQQEIPGPSNIQERVHLANYDVEVNPSNIQQQILEQIEHESASSRVLSNITNRDDQTSSRMRTHIGQLTHSNRSQIYDGMLSTVPHNEEEHATRTNRHVRQSRGRRNHNCARNYNENRGILGCRLPAPTTCPYCYARLFTRETLNMCCLKGKVALPPIQSPPEMVALFSDQTNEGRHFRQNIRAYNHAFAFTSMRVHVDERINIGGRGIYTFRAQGALYHKIGGLLPHEGNRPRFLQAYIYDTEHEVENRMCESEVLDRCVVEKIQQMLNNHNPFVHTLRSLGQCQDLPNCKLILKEQPIDRRQYSLPSASQVAAIIIDGDDATIANGRDIVVETISGRLSHVRDYVGFYDPLQYPLLLPYGTYGWDVNSRDDSGRAITCCDYYAYMLQVCTDNIIYFPIYINE